MNARPTDVVYLVNLADHADMEHGCESVVSAQDSYDDALQSLLRVRVAERFHLNEARRLGAAAHYEEVRIEAALAAGAQPREIRRD